MKNDAKSIRRRLDAGEAAAAIAKALGVTVRRVYQVAGPKTPKPRLTREKIELVRTAYRRGESTREIATRMKMSRTSVGKAVVDLVKDHSIAAADVEQIAASARAGHTAGTIARSIGRAVPTVQAVIKRETKKDWIWGEVVSQAERLGWSPDKVAREAGVDQEHVRQFFARRRAMGTKQLQHVLKAMGGSIAWK